MAESQHDRDILLQAQGIYKRFPGVLALADVDFDLRAGEVHVLLGENGAGKSTLVKILCGAYRPDAGRITVAGEDVRFTSPIDAQRCGIRVIHQEFNLAAQLSAAENVFLGNYPLDKRGLIDWRRMNELTGQIFAEMEIRVDPRARASSLSVGQRQMLEIARALSLQGKILIMDEPTSALNNQEVAQLFRMINQLRSMGVGIVYISHRLEEIFRLADRITVLKDGRKVGTVDIGQATQDSLIRMMVGRTLSEMYPYSKRPITEDLLTIRHLNRGNVLKDINLTLRRGEIVGLAGLQGAGRTEFARAVFGLDPVDSGEIEIAGRPIRISSPGHAIAAGIGLLPEDRRNQGVISLLPLRHNVSMASLKRFVRRFLLNLRQEADEVQLYINKLRIKAESPQTKVMTLSGGNQQKVVLAKWMCSQCEVLIFDEPTIGIDVGAKIEVYNFMMEMAASGKGIILISSDLPEILSMSDRIFVMKQGAFVAEFTRDEATEEKVMQYAM